MGKPAASVSSLPISATFRAAVRGFTLIELVVAMGVAAVLATIAAPSVAQLAASLQLSSASNTLVSGLRLARNEAIKRNARVVLCKTIDGIHCTRAGGWEQGWIIFHDVNNNGLRESAETIIHHERALSAGLRMTGNTTVASYISFAPTGGTKLVAGGFQAGTITLCRALQSQGDGRQIILNAAGRPRVQKTQIGTCE